LFHHFKIKQSLRNDGIVLYQHLQNETNILPYHKYQPVIGLEVHAQLLTETKIFSPEIAAYGGEPNTHLGPISVGHPGTLPFFNKKALELAVKMGLATNCQIQERNEFSRKHYFYADLPKGYQITQMDTPICYSGHLDIEVNGETKRIRINRIHLEEDAGKSTHDIDPHNTLVDLNRAGTPLIEIVTEPDIRSADEAYAYLSEIRKLVRYLGICDGNMEEGSLRCDANVSVMLKDADQYGQRAEVKNLNSIRNLKRAIEHEVIRQIDILEVGGKVVQETRSFDADNGTTFSLRTKEDADDYRYFPEPDLPPVVVTQGYIDGIKSTLPALPQELFKQFVTEFGLPASDASILTEERDIALFYVNLIGLTTNYKAAANWVIHNVQSYLKEQGVEIAKFPITFEHLAGLINMIDDGVINYTIANQQLFPAMLSQPKKAPDALAAELNLIQQRDIAVIGTIVQQILENNPNEVARFRNGEQKLQGFFMGLVMKASKGVADPKAATKVLIEKLNQK
jgi:aspartyl-tRNA(Asn)/glutamyl-tRNA(Gln) amidotransferase subunit B